MSRAAPKRWGDVTGETVEKAIELAFEAEYMNGETKGKETSRKATEDGKENYESSAYTTNVKPQDYSSHQNQKAYTETNYKRKSDICDLEYSWQSKPQNYCKDNYDGPKKSVHGCTS